MTQAEYKKMTLTEMQSRRWKTAQSIENAHTRVPAGVEVTIVDKQNGLNIGAPACPHCGVSVFIRKVSCYDLQEIFDARTDP